MEHIRRILPEIVNVMSGMPYCLSGCIIARKYCKVFALKGGILSCRYHYGYYQRSIHHSPESIFHVYAIRPLARFCFAENIKNLKAGSFPGANKFVPAFRTKIWAEIANIELDVKEFSKYDYVPGEMYEQEPQINLYAAILCRNFEVAVQILQDEISSTQRYYELALKCKMYKLLPYFNKNRYIPVSYAVDINKILQDPNITLCVPQGQTELLELSNAIHDLKDIESAIAGNCVLHFKKGRLYFPKSGRFRYSSRHVGNFRFDNQHLRYYYEGNFGRDTSYNGRVGMRFPQDPAKVFGYMDVYNNTIGRHIQNLDTARAILKMMENVDYIYADYKKAIKTWDNLCKCFTCKYERKILKKGIEQD